MSRLETDFKYNLTLIEQRDDELNNLERTLGIMRKVGNSLVRLLLLDVARTRKCNLTLL